MQRLSGITLTTCVIRENRGQVNDRINYFLDKMNKRINDKSRNKVYNLNPAIKFKSRDYSYRYRLNNTILLIKIGTHLLSEQ